MRDPLIPLYRVIGFLVGYPISLSEELLSPLYYYHPKTGKKQVDLMRKIL